jgi:GNAT superfamily N-acetyltransferase
MRLCDSEAVRLWWDVQPSWQNTTNSIHRARSPHVILGDEDAYAVLFPENGDLAQLAVRPEARRQGRGRALLEQAAQIANKPLRIMNVDERDRDSAAFLEHVGANHMVRQLEMVRALD